MGRKRNTDRMHVTATEWVTGEGGANRGIQESSGRNSQFHSLPFDCCALSMLPAENPVCSPSGTIFDIVNIVPWLKKYGTDPTTGKPLSGRDLFKINFHRNANGDIHCPVSFKVFNKFSHIVAIRPSGNVFSYEAVQNSNLKTKSMTDLLTGEPFTRDDIITIQDPHGDQRSLASFHYIQNNLSLKDQGSGSVSDSINVTPATERVLSAVRTVTGASPSTSSSSSSGPSSSSSATPTTFTGTRLPKGLVKASGSSSSSTSSTSGSGGSGGSGRLATSTTSTGSGSVGGSGSASASSSTTSPAISSIFAPKKHNDGKERAHFSTGMAAASFTSTSMPIQLTNELAVLEAPKVKPTTKKGYVTLETTVGDLNLELHCDLVPLTCNNFLKLAAKGYYNDTIFHRLIKNFMVQGGDPTGKGTGGESIYGGKFEDEFKPNLTHTGRGILSMANSGPNTNGSQFFITFRSATHLDRKHSVFGRVVGGLEVLNAIEKIETDSKDRPRREIRLIAASVFVDPFLDAELEGETGTDGSDSQRGKEQGGRKRVFGTRSDRDRYTAADEEEEEERFRAKAAEEKGRWFSSPGSASTETFGAGIGKYINRAALPTAAALDSLPPPTSTSSSSRGAASTSSSYSASSASAGLPSSLTSSSSTSGRAAQKRAHSDDEEDEGRRPHPSSSSSSTSASSSSSSSSKSAKTGSGGFGNFSNW